MLIRNSRPTMCRCALAAITGLVVSLPVAAQDVFEEIVVIAQKREQNIMVVPVAVTSVSGAELEASGIRDVFEMQQNVPGLIVGQSQTSTTSNFAIRGVGSTSQNFGVESSVGLYVDEVYRSRQSSMINDLVDVHAVGVGQAADRHGLSDIGLGREDRLADAQTSSVAGGVGGVPPVGQGGEIYLP